MIKRVINYTKTITLSGTEGCTGRSTGIVFLRGIICIYIILCHIAGWYKFSYGVGMTLKKIVGIVEKITQPLSETNPGVIFFIVLSGYCIHRNLPLKKSSTVNFIVKRICRLVPVFLAGTILGYLLWRGGTNRELVELLSSTEEYQISFKNLILRITGINAIIPFCYTSTYFGNAALCTVIVDLYLCLLYPILVKVDSLLSKLVFVLIWMAVFVFSSFHEFVWWNNISIVSFLPFFYLGAIENHDEIVDDKRLNFVIFIVYVSTSFLFNKGIFAPVLRMISEIRKLLLAFLFAKLIKWTDKKRHLDDVEITFGLYDIGKISYSLYAIHGPLIIFLMQLKTDILSIVFILLFSAYIVYLLVENKLSNVMYRWYLSK